MTILLPSLETPPAICCARSCNAESTLDARNTWSVVKKMKLNKRIRSAKTTVYHSVNCTRIPGDEAGHKRFIILLAPLVDNLTHEWCESHLAHPVHRACAAGIGYTHQ